MSDLQILLYPNGNPNGWSTNSCIPQDIRMGDLPIPTILKSPGHHCHGTTSLSWKNSGASMSWRMFFEHESAIRRIANTKITLRPDVCISLCDCVFEHALREVWRDRSKKVSIPWMYAWQGSKRVRAFSQACMTGHAEGW